jgi:hypothetical protein
MTVSPAMRTFAAFLMVFATGCHRRLPISTHAPCLPIVPGAGIAQPDSSRIKVDGPPPSTLIAVPYNVAINGRLVTVGHADADRAPASLTSIPLDRIRALAILSEAETGACWGSALRHRTVSFNVF